MLDYMIIIYYNTPTILPYKKALWNKSTTRAKREDQDSIEVEKGLDESIFILTIYL